MNQASHNRHHFTRNNSRSWRELINTPLEERISVTSAIWAENESSHTQLSVSENQNENTTMTQRKTSVNQKTARKAEKYESRILTTTLKLNKNHRILYIPLQYKVEKC